MTDPYIWFNPSEAIRQPDYARAVDGHVMLAQGGWFWAVTDATVLARIRELGAPEHEMHRAQIIQAYEEAKRQRPSECEHLPALRIGGGGTSPL